MTAPTAAEVAAARQWLDEVTLSILKADGHEQTVDHVRTLLAALDAAEARADTAEKSLDIVRARWVEADRRANDNAERAENMRAEWVPWTKKLATAERERDELRDALKLYEAFPELATGDTARRDEQRAAYNGLRWVLGLLAGLDDGRQDSVAKAFRPVVEKIKRERDEARAALKPFAKFNETVDAIVPDSSVILYLDRGSTGLRAGDFRRAAEILKEAPRG